MHRMPEVPRGKLPIKEEIARRTQRDIDARPFSMKIALMRDEGNIDVGTRWTLENNQESISHGWIIINPDGSDIPELFSVKKGRTPYEIFHQDIKPKIHADGLEARAYAALVGLKFRHPDHTFLYEKEPREYKSDFLQDVKRS